MILLDANILLYAWDSTSPEHPKSRRVIEGLLSGTQPVGIPWQTVGAFLRLTTHPRLPGQRLTMEQAVAIVDGWLEQPCVAFIKQGDKHWDVLKSTLLDGQVRGPMTTDAQLAALAIETGAILYTTDRDFARFPGLRWLNPLT